MEAMTGSLEENVLTLLVWSDTHAPTVAMQVNDDLFSTEAYRLIASRTLDYFEKFGNAPKVHAKDLLERELRRNDSRTTMLNIVFDTMERIQANINPDYITSRLSEFIERGRWRRVLADATDEVETGDLSKIPDILYNTGTKVSYSQGIWFDDTRRVLSSLDQQDEDYISSGLNTLDRMGVRPRRKTMFLIIASAKKGKTWFLVNIGKIAYMQGLKVLHVTLEMSEEEIAQRYTQSLLSLTTDQTPGHTLRIAHFQRDKLGRHTKIEYHGYTPDKYMSDRRPVIAKELKMHTARRRRRLLIKEFPTASLTIGQLNAYIDSLERTENFKPDLLIVDYPDLMEIDPRNVRTDTGRVYRQLRGMAVQRNMALVVPTQGNRGSASAERVTQEHVAEDWSKIGTADTICTYSQTPLEREHGLARVIVDAARGVRDKFVVMLSQNYDVGQFAFDDVYLSKFVQDEVDRVTGQKELEDVAD